MTPLPRFIRGKCSAKGDDYQDPTDPLDDLTQQRKERQAANRLLREEAKIDGVSLREHRRELRHKEILEILSHVTEQNGLSEQQIADHVSYSKCTVRNDMIHFRNKGLVKMKGAGRICRVYWK